METLVEVLNGLSPQVFKELDKFIRQQNGGETRKDRQLLLLLSKDAGNVGDKDIRKFYKMGAKEPLSYKKRKAYLQWKYLLNKQIEDFCFYKISLEDASQHILKSLMVARFLLNYKKYSLAYKYLYKAEETARKAQQYELLQKVYSLQIEFAWTNTEIDIQQLIHNWKQNSLLAQKNEVLNMSLNLIRQQLIESHKNGQTVDVDQLTAKTLHEYGVDDEVKNNAGMIYKLAMIVHTVMEEKKDFAGLAEYLVKAVESMEAKKLFEKHNHRLKIELLTSICRAYIKFKDFASCEHYLKLLKKEHELYPQYTLLNIKSMMIEYDLLESTHRIDEAEKHIYGIANSHVAQLAKEDDYFFCAFNANLISCNYCKGQLQATKKYMTLLLNNEKRLKNFGGVEFLICVHFADCMINTDLEDYDYAISKLNAMRGRFSTFFKKPENIRYRSFLKLLREIVINPNVIYSSATQEEIKEFLKLEEPPVGSSEFLSFNAYLLSKMEKRSN